MKKVLAFLGIFLFVLSQQVVAADESEHIQKVNESIEVLTDITKIPEKDIPPSLLGNCHGIAIIPGVLKAGFVVGARYGRGVLAVRDEQGRWQNPFFISLVGGSFGWQIGVQSTDIILVFKSKKSVDKIRNGKFTLGADAAVAAGPVGRQAQIGTDIKLKSEIYSYARSRGLFAGIALDGAALQIDTATTEKVYGASLYDIEKGLGAAPAEVLRLKQLLAQHTSEEEKTVQ